MIDLKSFTYINHLKDDKEIQFAIYYKKFDTLINKFEY